MHWFSENPLDFLKLLGCCVLVLLLFGILLTFLIFDIKKAIRFRKGISQKEAAMKRWMANIADQSRGVPPAQEDSTVKETKKEDCSNEMD